MICHYHLVFWVLGVVLCCIGIRFWFSCQATDGFEWICNILSNCFQSFARGRENFLRKFELAKVVGRSVATFVCLEFGTGQRNGLELGMARKLRDVERTESNPYSLPDCTLQIGNYRMAQFFFFTLCLGTGSRWGGSPRLWNMVNSTLVAVFSAVFSTIIIFTQIISLLLVICYYQSIKSLWVIFDQITLYHYILGHNTVTTFTVIITRPRVAWICRASQMAWTRRPRDTRRPLNV